MAKSLDELVAQKQAIARVQDDIAAINAGTTTVTAEWMKTSPSVDSVFFAQAVQERIVELLGRASELQQASADDYKGVLLTETQAVLDAIKNDAQVLADAEQGIVK